MNTCSCSLLLGVESINEARISIAGLTSRIIDILIPDTKIQFMPFYTIERQHIDKIEKHTDFP